MESKVFDVEAAGLTLQFEFYTFDSIQEDLKKIFGDQVKQYNMSIYKKWSQIRQDQDKDSHKIKYFTLGIILGFLVMFYGIISNNNVFIIGIGIVVMGIDVVLLPFTTPETINFLGYQKSKFAGRISGILLIAVGVWMCFIQ